MRLLPSTNKYFLRFTVGKIIINFTNHAYIRTIERGIEPRELIEGLRGKPLKDYRRLGVAAKLRGNDLRIITVWKPNLRTNVSNG